jgi:hypothetical protein
MAVIRPVPAILWIGAADDVELALARRAAARLVDVVDAADVATVVAEAPAPFIERSPVAIVLASPAPDRWSLADCAAVSRRWPLAPLVSVATTLVEGRRRSGPPLPGVEEVAWHEFAGRLAWWLDDRRRGIPGGLGMPATARREERLVEAAGRVAGFAARGGAAVSIAAARAADLEGLADLVTASGRPILRRTLGRPALDEPAEILVWDVSVLSPAELIWVGLLSANRPALAVILLDSFPRGDLALAAVRAGAAAVLARPVSLEALTGTLLALEARRRAVVASL